MPFFFCLTTLKFLEYTYIYSTLQKKTQPNKKTVKNCLVCAVVTKGRQKFSSQSTRDKDMIQK